MIPGKNGDFKSSAFVLIENKVVEAMETKVIGRPSWMAKLRSIMLCCSWLLSSDLRLAHSTVRFVVKSLPVMLVKPMVNSRVVKDCLSLLAKLADQLQHKPVFISPKTFGRSKKSNVMLLKDLKPVFKQAPWVPPAKKGSNSSSLDRVCIEKWTEAWIKRSDCRQTKLWFAVPDKMKSSLLMKHNRKEVGLFIQFITGHGWLNRHVALLDQALDTETSIERSRCRLCLEEEETPVHLVCQCFALTVERVGIFGACNSAEHPPASWSPGQLLRFLKVPQINEMFKDQV